jgi:hypothetical protein
MILEHLGKGKENGIKMHELAILMNCNTREIRQQVNRERLEGAPIVGDEHGYYIADTADDIKENVLRLRQQAKTLFKICQALEKSANKVENHEGTQDGKETATVQTTSI